MNAIAPHVVFASAYRQLQPAERVFVDSVVVELERIADKTGERISLVLHKPIPQEIVLRSNGLLERPMVTAAISERITEIAAAQELTVQRMVKEMMSVAFSSMGDYMTVDEDGTPMFDLARCTPEQLAAIKSIDVEEVGDGLSKPMKRKFKIQLHDKLGGMKMLQEFMGMRDPENPHWSADINRVNQAQVSSKASTQEAGDQYGAMIGD